MACLVGLSRAAAFYLQLSNSPLVVRRPQCRLPSRHEPHHALTVVPPRSRGLECRHGASSRRPVHLQQLHCWRAILEEEDP